MAEKDHTNAIKWFQKLEILLSQQPKSMDVVVCSSGDLLLCTKKERIACEDENGGSLDTLEGICNNACSRLIPYSEGL